MSDGPTNFRKGTLRMFTKALHTPHHFTLPYCPCSNGAVELLGRELLRIARAILSELKMRPDAWPDILALFQSALNISPSKHRDHKAPINTFLGRDPTPPIKTCMNTTTGTLVTIYDLAHERALNLSLLQERMDALHPKISLVLQENRERSRKPASRGKSANFSQGDFVLVAREDFQEGEKICLRWRGTRRIAKVYK